MRRCFFILALFLSACSTYNEEQKTQFDERIETYIKKNDLDLEKSESGLYYNIINEGSGARVLAKDAITFSYKGTLIDGTVFDEQTEPVTFRVSELIGAWKEAVLKLNEGGEAFIIAPPQLGYGERELEKIPANSIVIFTLKVHKVE